MDQNRVYDPYSGRGQISYQGQYIGSVQLADHGFRLILRDVDALVTLLNLSADDALTVDEKEIPYQYIREDILPRLEAVFFHNPGHT